MEIRIKGQRRTEVQNRPVPDAGCGGGEGREAGGRGGREVSPACLPGRVYVRVCVCVCVPAHVCKRRASETLRHLSLRTPPWRAGCFSSVLPECLARLEIACAASTRSPTSPRAAGAPGQRVPVPKKHFTEAVLPPPLPPRTPWPLIYFFWVCFFQEPVVLLCKLNHSISYLFGCC